MPSKRFFDEASMALHIAMARQKLQTDPVQVIEAAKEGSLSDMTALSLLDDSNDIPRALHPLIEELLFHHLHAHPPDPGSPIDVTSYFNKKIRLCLVILYQFTGAGRYFDDAEKQKRLLDLWPNIFRWLDYLALRLAESKILEVTDGEGSRFSHLLAISHALMSISEWPSTANKALHDLNTFRLAAGLWADRANSTDPQDLRCSANCLISFQWCDRKDFRRFDILSDILGGESKVSAHALRRLRVSHSVDRSGISGGSNDYDAIATQIGVLHLLCGGDETCYHTLRRTILWDGAMGLVIDHLSKFIVELQTKEKASGAICACLKFISLIFKAADAAVWTRYALRHRILEVLWSLGPLYGRLDVIGRGHLTIVITNLCRFFNIGRTRSIAFDAFDKLDTSARKAPVEFMDTWKVLSDCLLSRSFVRCMNTRVLSIGAELLCCSNPSCNFSGQRKSFKKCAGCKSSLYCSRRCQTQGWREGKHREECSAIRKQGCTTRFSVRDRKIVTRIAFAEVRRHMPGLRALAAKDFPDEKFEHLNIHVDLSTEPAVLSVEPFQHTVGTPFAMKHRIGDHMVRVVWARQRRGDANATFMHIKFEDGNYFSPGHLYLASHLSKSQQTPPLTNRRSLRKAAVDYDKKPLANWVDELDELMRIISESSSTLGVPVWNDLLIRSVLAVYIADKDPGVYLSPPEGT